MTPLNFCRQARRQFAARQWGRLQFRVDHFLAAEKSAVRFLLPEDGVVIDDFEFRALDLDMRLSLPYPAIALEFQARPGVVHEKWIVLAAESPTQIQIHTAAWLEQASLWALYPAFVMNREQYGLRCPSDLTSAPEDLRPWLKDARQGEFLMRRFELFEHDPVKVDSEDEEHADVILRTSATVVLSLLNVLNCKNVDTTHTACSAKNAKVAAEKGLDTYRVLTLKGSGPAPTGRVAYAGSHASPREHLRRGHIRRLPTGNIWVNSTVVNAGALAKVHKTYRLAA